MKKKLLFVLICMFALVLFGCTNGGNSGNGGNEGGQGQQGGGEQGGGEQGGGEQGGNTETFSWKDKVVDKVEIVREKLQDDYDIDEFDLSMLYVLVTFEDGEKVEFDCGDSHFELNKPITSVGSPRLKIICTDDNGEETETANFTIHVVSYSLIDDRALEANANVIMAKRNGTKIDFVVAKTSGVAGGQMQFVFDTTKLTLGEITKNTSGFYVSAKVQEGKVQIGFASAENLETGTVICSIAFEGDYRASALAIDEEFNNACWKLVDLTTVEVDDIAYHVSKK